MHSNTAVNSASSSSPEISVHSWQSSEIFKDDIVSNMHHAQNTTRIVTRKKQAGLPFGIFQNLQEVRKEQLAILL